MMETAEMLHDAQQIAQHVYRLLVDGMVKAPTFPKGNVPIKVVAQVYGKNAEWVRAGIVSGYLPIGRATRNGELVTSIKQMDSRYGRIDYHVSPKKLWEDTGYLWEGEK
jgi:hypothetical protein